MSKTARDLLNKAYIAAYDSLPETALVEEADIERAVYEALKVVVTDLQALLYPEQYPGYDPDHIYWDGKDLPTPEQLLRRKQVEAKLYSKRIAFDAAGGRGVELADEIDALVDELENLPKPFDSSDHDPFEWSTETVEWCAEWAESLHQELG